MSIDQKSIYFLFIPLAVSSLHSGGEYGIVQPSFALEGVRPSAYDYPKSISLRYFLSPYDSINVF